MIHMNHPQQSCLFDPYPEVLGPKLFHQLKDSRQGEFRQSLLQCMPVNGLTKHFDDRQGRPTKELYAMAGLIFIKEFHNWTMDHAVEQYCFNNLSFG